MKHTSFFAKAATPLKTFFLAITLLVQTASEAQCYEDFYVYQLYPYGQLCSPQYATLRAEYFNSWGYVSGEFRWYTSETDPNPVFTDYVSSDFNELTSDYTVYATNGMTLWVSFYNYNTMCESYRTPYMFYIASTPTLFQDYAKQCRYESAKLQVSSNSSGVTFQLYKLIEYYDPYYGQVQDYQYQQSNTSGYFEIFDFDPTTDIDKFYIKLYQPYGCSTPFYYQVWFEVTGADPPVITGNTSILAGQSSSLFASGIASNFDWFNHSNSLVNQGWMYNVPSNLLADNYTYTVQGKSWDGTCLTDVATVTIAVNMPPAIYSPLYNSSNFTKTIDLSKPVGIISGSTAVNSAGAATFEVAISTPPGSGGVQPNLGITYNSNSGNSALGYGWSLSGLSVISRSGRSIYHNEVASPVSYTNQDAFVLDGLRLNPITGINGAHGTIYASEMEGYSRVTSYCINGANEHNPSWFKLTQKDGTILEYGNSSDSRFTSENGTDVMMWRLNRITDIFGNYIDFKYEKGFRDSRIVEIIYTGNTNAGLAPYNKIKFNYETRNDKSTIYDAGGSINLNHLISSIVVLNETNTVRTYSFKYGFDNITSLLKEIIESGSDGSSLNSTIFLYGDAPQNFSTVESPDFTGEISAGDFNGDGKSDILATTYYYSDGIRLNSGYKIITDPAYGTTLYEKVLPAGHNVIENKKLANFITSDFNMDGRDDILLVNSSLITNPSGSLRRKVEKFVLNLTTNTGYTELNLPVYTHQYIHENGNYIIPGDFDGDSNADFISMLGATTPSGSYSYKAFFNSPAKYISNVEISEFAIPVGGFYGAIQVIESDKIIPLEFNGDGKQELLIIKGSQAFIMTITNSGTNSYVASVIHTFYEVNADSKIFPGDFNGDGKTDLLVRNSNGSWKILHGTGAGYKPISFNFNQTVNITGPNGFDKISIADFNGDGKSDILHGYNNSSSTSMLSFYYSKSYGLFHYEQYGYNKLLPYIDFMAGDFNGDGKTDLCSKLSYTSTADVIFIKPYGTERLLKKITNGFNVTTEFKYKTLTDKNLLPHVYNRTISLDDGGSKGIFNYVQLPIQVVSSVNTPNGIDGINTIQYNYENAVIHRHGKGFLGFFKVVSKDISNGITSISENEINGEFVVPHLKKQYSQFTATGELLSESTITTSFVNLSIGASDPKRFFMRTDKVLTIDHIAGAATENTNTYDNYGNITSSTAKIGALSAGTVNAVETVLTNASFGTFNSPFPARPTAITVSKTRAGASTESSTTTFNYHTNGSLASQTVFSGLPKSVTTSYSYNSLGNVTSVSIASAGLSTRTTNAIFDNKGRFAVTKSILIPGELPIIESLTYDSKWGQLLSHTSGDCLTTLFEYDAFGRPKKTTLPTGVFISNSLVWDVQSGNVFYSFTDYPGGKPDTKQWYDFLGRPTKMQEAGFNNQWLTQLTTYNAKGKVASQTNSYYSNESPVTTTFSYDAYNRVTNASSPVSSISTTYMKLANAQFQVVTSNSAGQSTTKISDASGKVIQSSDNGGQLNFSYDSRGNQLSVSHGSNILVNSTYDAYGRQTTLTDKNAGTITYEYDGFGQLLTQTDNSGNTYTMNYDVLGRITNKQGPEGTTTYEYFYNNTTGCRNSNITKVTSFGGIIKEFTYDTYHRMNSEKLTVDGTAYTTQYAYNNFGQLTQTTYPSGIVVNNSFDTNGNLLTVSGGDAGNATTLFTATGMNGFGQYTNYSMGNGKSSQITYNYGIPTRYYTQGVQDLNLNFNYTTGNLTSRYDAIKNLTENFQYDNLNRFNTASIGSTQQLNVNYDQNGGLSMGNIVSKTDAGNYVYKNDKINAVAYITNPAGATAPPVTSSSSLQEITYTAFLKTATITEDNYRVTYTYGPSYERVKSVGQQTTGISLPESKLYFGNYEEHNLAGQIHYIEGGDGLCAIIVKKWGVTNFYFVYKDHLGSLLTLTDINGNVVAEQNFDAWGRKRNPATWQYTSVPSVPNWLYRGYTGHEHLERFALINMNGRMYDPVQGRMMSADNYVPGTFSTQAFNRYSYAHNNPLTFIDPDGNHPAAVVILVAAAKAAAIATTVYLTTNLLFGDPDNITLRGALTSAGMGALGGALGGAFSLYGNSIGAFGQSLTYSMMQNVASQVAVDVAFGNRVTFGSVAGAAVGGLIDGAIPEFKGIPFKKYNFGAGVVNTSAELAINTARGALVGGFSSVVGGGSFEEGARSGAVSRFVRTSINLAVLGPTIRPTGDIKLALNKMEKDLDIKLTGPYGPTYRIGGAWRNGLAVGKSFLIRGYNEKTGQSDINNIGTWVHESYHYYQQLRDGWARQFTGGVHEQWWLAPFRGIEVYEFKLFGDKYYESQAQGYQKRFRF